MSEEVAIADWEAVEDVLNRMIEGISEGISELCELKYFHGCTAINKDILPYFRRMLKEAERKSRDEELPELGSEMLGGSIRVLTREEAREVLESGDFEKTFDTNRIVRAAGAVAGDMVEDEETGTYYHVVRGNDLPPRGTGLETGAAGDRGAGVSRTEEERALRHEELYGEEEELF